MSTPKTRRRPNILITGTPCTGKSSMAVRISQNLNFEFVDIGEIVKDNKFHTEFDEEYNSYVLDEDKLLDYLEEKMDSDDGGVVLDYHSSDFFPQRWFDFVFVLRCDTDMLYDRMIDRGYKEKKLRENIECEIFGTVGEEAMEAYPKEIVYEMINNTLEQQASNIQKITEIVAKRKR